MPDLGIGRFCQFYAAPPNFFGAPLGRVYPPLYRSAAPKNVKCVILKAISRPFAAYFPAGTAPLPFLPAGLPSKRQLFPKRLLQRLYHDEIVHHIAAANVCFHLVRHLEAVVAVYLKGMGILFVYSGSRYTLLKNISSRPSYRGAKPTNPALSPLQHIR